jgi:DNA-binding GntR family transcriptional regulator
MPAPDAEVPQEPVVTSMLADALGLFGSGFGARPVDRYMTKAQLAADSLRQSIASGRIKRGQRLRFSELIEDLGVSATPIREALRILETEGLVSMESHREVRVTEFTADDALEIYEIRAMLESHATRQAVPKLTPEHVRLLEDLHLAMKRGVEADDLREVPELNARWHHTLYAAAASKYLHFIIQKLWAWFPWDIWLIPDRAGTSMDEHEGILEAIRSRDADKAAERMQAHILSGRFSVSKHLREASD